MKKHTDASITFTWEKDTILPKVKATNLNGKNVNDVFAMAAENLMVTDPRYYSILMSQLNVMYESMYSDKNTVN